MKKTLLSFAVLGALAGSAVAADVTLYGLVDYGFNYQHTDLDDNQTAGQQDAQDRFEMRSGMNSGSRFGLKGTEDLGNGYTVGFVLENGFDADDGTFDSNGDSRIFGRESQLYVKGPWGQLGFGRVGQLASANGTYSLLGQTSPFSSGWGDSVGQKFVMANGWGRFDNTVTYVSPNFAGFQVHAQYSFKNDTTKKGDEGKSSADRYYGIAATFKTQNLYLVGIVDSVNYGKYISYLQDYEYQKDQDDQWTFTLGGNYDFQFMKVYAIAQYFKNAAGVGQKSILSTGFQSNGYTYADSAYAGADGFGVALGLGIPCFGGTAKFHVGYLDAEASEDYTTHYATGTANGDFSRWNVAVGYDYNLSKRTSLYTAAAYTKDDRSDYIGHDSDPSAVEVMAGMIHRF